MTAALQQPSEPRMTADDIQVDERNVQRRSGAAGQRGSGRIFQNISGCRTISGLSDRPRTTCRTVRMSLLRI